MELDPTMIWNLVLTLIVAPFAWAFSKMFQEVKRLQILLNQTREEYAKRSDVQQEVKEIMRLSFSMRARLELLLVHHLKIIFIWTHRLTLNQCLTTTLKLNQMLLLQTLKLSSCLILFI